MIAFASQYCFINTVQSKKLMAIQTTQLPVMEYCDACSQLTFFYCITSDARKAWKPCCLLGSQGDNMLQIK